MGGRGSSSGGGGGGGGGGAGGGIPVTPQNFQILDAQIAPTQQAAQAANNAAFSATDNAPYHDLYNGRQYFQNQNLTIDQQLATINYLSPTPENGSMYSMSQNLNSALVSGKPLTANQQFVYDNMQGAMHNLGYNLNLTRYDHSTMVNGLLKQAGINTDYSNLSQGQIKKALVGMQYGENKFISTSYNDFKNAPAASKSTFDTRAVRIEYKAKASTKAMMPGNGPGGALGEIVLAPSGSRKNMKVVDVKMSGKSARRQGTQSYSLKQVTLVVEVD